MRVLISAYACEPEKGSEPGVGFAATLAAAGEHDVWVLTRENNVASIEHAIANHPFRSRIHIVGFDLDPRVLRLKKALRWGGTQIYYELWQRRISDIALALDRLHHFDVVHHATFASNWTRIGVASVSKPLVVGPIGGSADTPWRLWPVLGLRGLPGEIFRRIGRPVLARVTGSRRAISSASAVLIQNPGTFGGLPDSERVRLLPNGLIGALAGDPVAGQSHTGVAVVFAGTSDWLEGTDPGDRGDAIPGGPLDHTGHLRIRPGSAPLERLCAARRVCRRGWSSTGRSPGKSFWLRSRGDGLGPPGIARGVAAVTVGEALSLGTPVVCLDLAGPPVLRRTGRDIPSRVVPPSSPGRTAREIAAALNGVVGSVGDRTRLLVRGLSKGCWTRIDLAVRTGRTS